MATFLQLFGEYLDAELGSADRSNIFTTAKRKDAINRAHLEFAKQTGCFQRVATITVVDGTQEYDLDATGIISAGDYIDVAPQGPEHKYTDSGGSITYTAGEDFPRIDIPQLNRESSGWRSTTAVSEKPTSWYLREDGGSLYFGLVPVPDIGAGDSAVVTLPYLAIPPDMTDDAHEPFSVVMGTSPKRTLRPWHMALVHYAAALLEPLRKNYQAEKRQRELFAGMVADYLQKQRPKGGQRVTFARNYYAEMRTRFQGSRVDPRSWP